MPPIRITRDTDLGKSLNRALREYFGIEKSQEPKYQGLGRQQRKLTVGYGTYYGHQNGVEIVFNGVCKHASSENTWRDRFTRRLNEREAEEMLRYFRDENIDKLSEFIGTDYDFEDDTGNAGWRAEEGKFEIKPVSR